MDSLIVKLEKEDKSLLNTIIPNEVLVLIFSYLSTKEIYESVLPVCRKWRKLGNHPSLWLHLNFGSFDRSKQTKYVEILEKSPLLESFQCTEISNIFLLKHISKCSKLKELIIPYTNSLAIGTIKSLVNGLPMLTNLDLSYGQQTLSTANNALDHITNFSMLTTLNLDHCTWVNTTFIVKLARKLVHLECLFLEGNLLPPEILSNVILSIKKTLKKLSIKSELFSEQLLDSLIACSFLEELYVKVLLGPINLQVKNDYYSGDLRAFTNLKKLSVYNCIESVSHNHLTTMFGSCHNLNSSLSELYIYEANGDNLLALDIAANCNRLKSVTFEMWYRLTDEGIISIIEACCHLRTVTLLSCKQVVGCTLAKHFVDNKYPNLESITLDNCPTDTVAVKKYVCDCNLQDIIYIL